MEWSGRHPQRTPLRPVQRAGQPRRGCQGLLVLHRQSADRFPYEDLRRTNENRGQDLGEYELFDALRDQWLQQRYFDVQVEYAKVTPEDVFCRITVTNRGPDAAPIHILPHLWYRHTWSWEPNETAPRITRCGNGVADDFYDTVAAPDLTTDERLVQHQALAGLLLWCKQFYNYRVRRMALIDPDFAKDQMSILLRSTAQHPHGQVPAYEWSFGDTNPPIHAWAAWQVYQLDRMQNGEGDRAFWRLLTVR